VNAVPWLLAAILVQLLFIGDYLRTPERPYTPGEWLIALVGWWCVLMAIIAGVRS
jgi:hypothetical protein